MAGAALVAAPRGMVPCSDYGAFRRTEAPWTSLRSAPV